MFILTQQPSIAHTFIAQLRDVNVQTDSLRFRQNLQRLGSVLAYELSKDLPHAPVNIQTPLGEKQHQQLVQQPVLCTVLRAGLPFYNGFLDVFDAASSAFIGAWREENNEGNKGSEGGSNDGVSINLSYTAAPSLEGKDLIIVDPMLATGKSLVEAVEAISHTQKHGAPARIFIAAAIASQQGAAYVQKALPQAKLYVGDVDETLDANSFIVPGLGDAGDLAFGAKL